MQCIYSQYFWAQNDVPCQARAAGALEKALGVSESAATSKAGHFSTSLCDSVWRVPSPESKTASGGDGRGRARPGTTNLGCRSAGDHQVPGQVCVSRTLPRILGCGAARQASEGRAGEIPRRGVWTIAGHHPLHLGTLCLQKQLPGYRGGCRIHRPEAGRQNPSIRWSWPLHAG